MQISHRHEDHYITIMVDGELNTMSEHAEHNRRKLNEDPHDIDIIVVAISPGANNGLNYGDLSWMMVHYRRF